LLTNLKTKHMKETIYYTTDWTEDGLITIFHLPAGDISLYEDDAKKMHVSMLYYGFKVMKK